MAAGGIQAAALTSMIGPITVTTKRQIITASQGTDTPKIEAPHEGGLVFKSPKMNPNPLWRVLDMQFVWQIHLWASSIIIDPTASQEEQMKCEVYPCSSTPYR